MSAAARYLLRCPAGRAALALTVAGLLFLGVAVVTWAYCAAGTAYDVAAQQALVMGALGFGALAAMAAAPSAPSGPPAGPRHPQPSRPEPSRPEQPENPTPRPATP